MARFIVKLILMRKLLFCIPVLLMMGACAQTERTEAITAEITAAQMEGRNAARNILINNWNDTTGISKELAKARSVRLKYDTIGHTEASAAFDSTFNHTIKAVRPELAKKLGY